MSDELISTRLRRYRDAEHLSQEELGAALGVTARYIGMIENGTKDVESTSAIAKLFRLMEANRVRVDEVAGKMVVPHNGAHAMHEEAATYQTGTIGASHSHRGSLSLMDVLAQVRADLDVIERGPMHEKRRSLMFLREVHLPLLAKAAKIE